MRPTPKKSLILLLGLLYALAFGEAYLRVFGSSYFGTPGHSYVRPPYLYDEILGAPFRTNGWGMRGDDYRANVLKIMVLGGSATESGEVPEEESWPARMEAHLNARFGSKAGQVANAGKAGLASGHYIAHLQELTGPAGIDAAVILTGANDTDRIARYGKIQRIDQIGDPGYGLAFLQAFSQPAPDRLLATAGNPITRRLLLPHFLQSFVVKKYVQPLRNRLEDLLPGQKLWDKRLRLRASPQYPDVLARAAEDYAHNLSLMRDAARARGATPLFVTMPLFPEAPDDELAMLNKTLIAWCRREDASCLDLASLPPGPGGRWYEPGSHHFTREGADRAGKLMADALGKLLPGHLDQAKKGESRAQAL